jgi:hypothetical protein
MATTTSHVTTNAREAAMNGLPASGHVFVEQVFALAPGAESCRRPRRSRWKELA